MPVMSDYVIHSYASNPCTVVVDKLVFDLTRPL